MIARTKIIVTLGPASEGPGVLEDLLRAGADIVRLNLAHGTTADHLRGVRRVRAAERALGRPVGLLVDLPGPKIRLGELGPTGRTLRRGERVRLVTAPGFPNELPVRHRTLAKDVSPGHRIHLADGAVRLRARAVRGGAVEAVVETPGFLRSNAGVNLIDGSPALKAFTSRDRALLDAVLPLGVDFVGVSFVEGAADLVRVRSFLRGRPVSLVAKIERRAAVDALEPIVRAADAVMVARGDLGVELDFSDIPAVQRRIVETAERWGRPAIVATQVLESMIQNPRPTRAEATDVANAVLEGADALMLSGETSIGRHPREAVHALNEVILKTEARPHRRPDPAPNTEADRLALQARHLAELIEARAIVVPSVTGETAVRVARTRGPVPVIALVHDAGLQRRLTVHGGLESHRVRRLPAGRPSYTPFSAALEGAFDFRKGHTVVFFGRFRSPPGVHWFLETIPHSPAEKS
jgi:pyruvate kinase